MKKTTTTKVTTTSDGITRTTTTTTTSSGPATSTSTKQPQVPAVGPEKPLPSIPEEKTSDLVRVGLKAHNEKRALHNCPPLGYNEDLAKLAKEWAESLVRRNAFEHRKDCPHGENIYMRGGSQPISDEQAIQQSVDSWYAEIADYKFFGTEPDMHQLLSGKATGHFTQLIWKDTKSMGTGIAKGNQNKVVVVTNYSPAGNVLRFFKENVPAVAKK